MVKLKDKKLKEWFSLVEAAFGDAQNAMNGKGIPDGQRIGAGAVIRSKEEQNALDKSISESYGKYAKEKLAKTLMMLASTINVNVK